MFTQNTKIELPFTILYVISLRKIYYNELCSINIDIKNGHTICYVDSTLSNFKVMRLDTIGCNQFINLDM